jgi:hypothetical protein
VKHVAKFVLLSLTFGLSAAFVPCTIIPLAAADQPFVLSSPLNSTTPFNLTVPSTTSNGRAVKTVIVDFVTADCVATTGTTFVGSLQLRAFFSGNFAFYALAFTPPMPFVNDVEFVLTQKTLMFADPGSTITVGLSAGQPTCTVTFTGRLVPQ